MELRRPGPRGPGPPVSLLRPRRRGGLATRRATRAPGCALTLRHGAAGLTTAVNRRGTAIALWQVDNGSVQGAARRRGAAFHRFNLDTSARTTSPTTVTLGLHRGGRPIADWVRPGRSGALDLVTAGGDRRGTFGRSRAITPPGADLAAEDMKIGTDARGNQVAVWFGGPTNDTLFASTRRAGAAFGAPQTIATGKLAGELDFAMSVRGTALVAFTQQIGKQLVVRAARAAPHSPFGHSTTVLADGVQPAVGIDARGRAIVLAVRDAPTTAPVYAVRDAPTTAPVYAVGWTRSGASARRATCRGWGRARVAARRRSP